MIWKPMIDEEQIILKKKFNFQRCFYSLVGLGTTIAVILLTVGQIQQMKSNDPELAIALLFIVHSSLFRTKIFRTTSLFGYFLVAVLVSLLSTALACRESHSVGTSSYSNFVFVLEISNAVLTTLTIILLSVYSGVHFYLRYVLFYNHLQDDFYLLIVRHSPRFVFASSVRVHLGSFGFRLDSADLSRSLDECSGPGISAGCSVRMFSFSDWSTKLSARKTKPIEHAKSTTFSWFLYLDFILIVIRRVGNTSIDCRLSISD